MMNEIVNVFDFKFDSSIGHNLPITDRKGMTDAFRTNHFLSADEFFAQARIQQMRSAISRGIPSSRLFVFRSIPLPGLRSTDLSRESSRYRDMPAGYAAEALSRRDSKQSFSEHIGRCQREAGLAYLRRLCFRIDPNGQAAVCRRRFRAATRSNSLCLGFHDHRSVSVSFSMGLFSPAQRRYQTAHRDGSAGLYSLRDPYHSWKGSRRHLLGSVGSRTRRVLHHGSRLHRLCSSPPIHRTHSLLRDPSQKQPRLYSAILSVGRSRHRTTERPDYLTQGSQNLSTLSRSTPTDQFLRCRKTPSPRFLNKQLCLTRPDDYSALQVPLENRVVLQMDQTKSSNQGLLWHFRECRQNSNLDCYLRLRAGCHHQKEAPNRANTQRNSPSFEHHAF